MRPLLSAQCLAHHLKIPLVELRRLASEADDHYRVWDKEKNGKTRRFTVPDKELSFVQRRILRRILDQFSLPAGAHGGVKGKSPMTNAQQHCGKPLVVTQDIRDFYPSVSHKEVAKMFRREFGCGRETRWLLTRLTTVNRQLPQGSPTSTAIANILLASTVDRPTEQSAQNQGATATRFVDDFAYSGKKADTLINGTAKSASRVGLRTWRKRQKLKIMPASGRQEVNGQNVNSPLGPSIPKEKRAKVRAAIHQLRWLPEAEVPRAIWSIRGRLAHLEQYNAGSARRLRAKFVRTLQERNWKGV